MCKTGKKIDKINSINLFGLLENEKYVYIYIYIYIYMVVFQLQE